MADEHSAYEALARDRRGSEQYRQGYAEARRAFLIGQAVRERRLTLGLSQTELATRAGACHCEAPGSRCAASRSRA
jgi:HTH-type transcriptional regulator / antitoxin HipB